MQRSLLIGLVAAVVLALGGWALWRQLRPAATTGDLSEPGADLVARAMRSAAGDTGAVAPMAGLPPGHPPIGGAAPIDSSAIKSRWQVEVRGFDLASLEPSKRELFLRFANAERCTCGCGYTLAGCKASDMTCEVSGAMLGTLLDSIQTGQIRSAKGVRTRPKPGAS